jgi:hypothetical protein
MIITVIDSTKDWLIANKEMIKSGFKKFVLGVVDAFKWIYNNWDGIVTGLKIWIGAWAALTVVNFGLNLMVTTLKVIDLLLAPASPLIIGIGLVVAGFIMINSEIKKSNEGIDTFGKKISETEGIMQQFSMWTQGSFGDMLGDVFNNLLFWLGQIYIGFLEIIKLLSATELFGNAFDEFLTEGQQWAATWGTAIDTVYNKLSKPLPTMGVNIGNSIVPMNLPSATKYQNQSLSPANKIADFTGTSNITQPLNAVQYENKNKNMIEIKLTSENGTKAEVLNNAGSRAVRFTLNNKIEPIGGGGGNW